MRIPFSISVAAALWAAAAVLAGAAPQQQGPTIRDIRVEAVGTVPVPAEQVLAQVTARPGSVLDRTALSEDIKSIQKAGPFSYAEARVEQLTADASEVNLVFRVSGRPKIRRLTIEGAEYFSNRKIRDKLDIGAGDAADDTILGQKAQKVRDDYRKEYFPNAKVTWMFTPVEGRPEYADVAIKVEEGRRAVVREIHFQGLERVPRGDMLDAMEQKRYNFWLSWMTGSGTYSPGLALADADALRRVMLDHGFLAAKVGVPSFRYVTEKKLDLTYPVEEGAQYKVGEWSITGTKVFRPEDLRGGVVARTGKTACWKDIQESAKNIRDYYGARGYIRTVVDPVAVLDEATATARIEYRVREGVLSTIRNIDIRGNTRTKDKVIRREISVAPGEIYNEVRIRSSENRLRNLDYFSYVGSYPEDTAKTNQYDLVFDVEEKSTGQFQIGVALSSVDNILGYAELSQGNFDLLGTLTGRSFTGAGQKLRLRGQVGSSRNDLELSFVEPWFLDRRLALGLDAYRHATSYSDEYDQTVTGASASLGHGLGAFNRITLLYGLEHIKIDDLGEDATRWIREEEGAQMKSYATLKLTRDTRDHTFIPTRGFRGTISGTLAGGPLGADTDIYGGELRLAQYFPMPILDAVLGFRGWGTVVQEYGDSDRVPIFDRIFMGGPRTVRAFKYRKVGPKDNTEEPIGGRSGVFGSAELTIPLFPYVRFAAFYDIGAVWMDIFKKSDEPVETEEDVIVGDGTVCAGYGIGVRLDIPQLPIQLDYAWPTKADEMNDSSGRFSFSLGYTY
jgi:outer membrane protein insertion porin family